MALIPLPTPHFRGSAFQIDDSDTFPSPIAITPNYATGKWALGVQSNVDDAQLGDIATAIERLIQQDLTGTGHTETSEVVDAVGSSAALTVSMAISGDTEVSISVGAQPSLSIGKAASLAALIRSTGHGTAYVP